MTTTYRFYLRDSATGLPRTGLFPTWHSLYYAATASGVAVPARPIISAVGPSGWYQFTWDPIGDGTSSSGSGPLVGTVDAGVAVAGADRYLPVLVDKDPGERADLAVQLLHNDRTTPATGVGEEVIKDRAGTVLVPYTRGMNGVTATRTSTRKL